MEEGSMDVDGDRIDAEMASDGEDDDSSDDERQEDELNRKKESLEQRIETDKTDYQAYEELIQVLSLLGDLEGLRDVREKFSKEYPLSPQLWRSWIEDEKKIATTFEEKKSLNELFERALKDYQSIDVWQEYVLFNIGLMSDGNAIENVRGILERAVETCGLNVASGSLLWDLYREFEKTILMSMLNSNQNNEEFEKSVHGQKQKIANLFFRQLSLPLLDMEKTYEEVQKWFQSDNTSELIDAVSLDKNYKKALDKLSRVLNFETALASAATDATLPIYETYLEYEKNPKEGGNELRRVICLYERALTDNPLNADLWSDYLKYVSESKLVPEDQEAVCYRALRNCSTQAKFWTRYITFLERRAKSKTEITEFFNKALQNAFPSASDYRSIWLAYIYYLRRQLDTLSKEDKLWENSVQEIRDVIVMAYQNLTECFGNEGDPECKLSLWWARFEAEVVHDYKQFRDIWTDILDSGHGKTSSYWIRYITMEWQYGDSKHMRRLCQRALSTITDNPKAITTLWLEYESMNGSLDSFLNCEKICDERLKKFADEKKVNEKHDDKKQKKPQKVDQKKEKNEISAKERSDKLTKPEDSQQKPKLQGQWSKLTVEKPKKMTPGTDIIGTHVPHDPSKDNRTVFVSNLDYTVSEDEVKSVLNKVGRVEEFRLARDFKGRSKGFGYYVFSSEKEAKEALKFDRTPINQRPMFISECNPDMQSRKSGLRYNLGLEKNKLFVKGLPKTMSQEDVEKIFSPHGKLKSVRLVTFRNGHSKGLAYVEYEDEASATHALVRTDQMEVEGKPISVVVSNPPERKNVTSLLSDKGEPLSSVALGGGSTIDKSDFGSRGRGRTQLSFVPTSVLNLKKPSSNESDAMDTSEPQSDTSKKSMSNTDFRNMLLKR